MSSNKVIFKRSSVAGKVPEAVSLDYGELALNYADGRLYYKTPDNSINYFETLGNSSNYINVNKQEHIVTQDGTNEYSIGYAVGYLEVHVNGVLLPSDEYTATNGVTVQIPNLLIGDEVSLSGIKSFNPAIATSYDRRRAVATEGQVNFPVTYAITSNGAIVQVYVNGILLQENEYSAVSGSDIILNSAASADDVVECIGYTDINLSTDPTSFTYDTFTGNGSTTSYQLSANPAASNSTDVYVDRVYQIPSIDYTISGDIVQFNTAPSNSSEIIVRTLTAALNMVGGGSGGSGVVYWNDILLKPTFSTVATSGSYNDLSNKPNLSLKQDVLVSGTNIKTINGDSILGSGNIDVPQETTVTTTSTAPATIDSFPTASIRSAEYLVTVSSSAGYSSFRAMVLYTGSDVVWNISSLLGVDSGEFFAGISGSNVEVNYTPTQAFSEIKFIRTSITNSGSY